MNVCPNKSHPDWIALVELIGENKAYKEYLLNGFDIPNPADYKLPDDLMNKSQVQFEYLGTRLNEKIIHRADRGYMANEVGALIYNPIQKVSQYNPIQAESIYKKMMSRAIQKLKTIPTLAYDASNSVGNLSGHAYFMDTLGAFGMNPIELQIVEDYINHRNLKIGDSDDFAIGIGLVMQTDKPLESFYNTASSYGRSQKSTVEKFYMVGKAALGQFQWEQLLKNFDAGIDSYVLHEDLINPSTGLQFTVMELLMKSFDKYIRSEKRINEIIKRTLDERGDVRKDLPFEQLQKDYNTIVQTMGDADGLIWKENQYFINLLAKQLGRFYEEKMREVHAPGDSDYNPLQKDIQGTVKDITSITDFSEGRLVAQYIGREVSVAQLRADAEQLSLLTELENLMKDVLKWHYEDKPKSWVDKFKVWTFSKQQRDVFDWMLERDAQGEYTGKTIARYAETEERWRKIAFERKKDADGSDTRFFVYPNRMIASFVENRSGLLSEAEKTRFHDIIDKYDGYNNFGELYENFTEEEINQSGQDTTYLRNLYIKVSVRSSDSAEFVILKREAQMYKGTPRGHKASAKIKMYDFIYERNNTLLSETGNDFYMIERANLPQTYADFQEEWSRYGFTKAWSDFWDKTHPEEDNDAYSIEAGVIISLNHEQNFETRKTTPYRTLRKKDNFSINVPQIFSHHFSTLIFKKHYDKVLPVMDAARVYYEMGAQQGSNFKNIVQFINDYANQKIFFQKTDFAKSRRAKVIRLASTMVVTQFLGLAPITSMINLVVGLSESYKHLIGDFGLSAGTERAKKGFTRMVGGDRGEIGFSGLVNGKVLFNRKAMAIMDYYGIETFSTSEIFQMGDTFGHVQDLMLSLQKSSEILVRGAALFAEMSDEQWDAFEIQADGKLNVSNHAPSELDVAEWKNKIGNIQGKYDQETKRLYHSNAVYQSFFLFKGWLIDYFRNRFVPAYRDQFGVEREGYYTSGFRLLKNARQTLAIYKDPTKEFTAVEQQNLKKIAYDVVFLISAALMQGAFDLDDEKENWYLAQLAKINSQVYLFMSPTGMVELVKNPFAGLYHIEMGSKILESLMHLQFEKAANQGYKLIPGRQIHEPIIDALTEDDEESN